MKLTGLEKRFRKGLNIALKKKGEKRATTKEILNWLQKTSQTLEEHETYETIDWPCKYKMFRNKFNILTWDNVAHLFDNSALIINNVTAAELMHLRNTWFSINDNYINIPKLIDERSK